MAYSIVLMTSHMIDTYPHCHANTPTMTMTTNMAIPPATPPAMAAVLLEDDSLPVAGAGGDGDGGGATMITTSVITSHVWHL